MTLNKNNKHLELQGSHVTKLCNPLSDYRVVNEIGVVCTTFQNISNCNKILIVRDSVVIGSGSLSRIKPTDNKPKEHMVDNDIIFRDNYVTIEDPSCDVCVGDILLKI